MPAFKAHSLTRDQIWQIITTRGGPPRRVAKPTGEADGPPPASDAPR